ncbi:terminase [Deinococcus xianganensis]|uniref:Terminase n=1 Tax=Deinococcus xianganensis TaxID=1507289 RepID=A0A6I4YKJ8_9DEIO|nr:terminase [Deinococcus xianganensis]MXV20274.1 terminase [Deinococcus xianganensis]
MTAGSDALGVQAQRTLMIKEAVMAYSDQLKRRFENEGRRRLKLLQRCVQDAEARVVAAAAARMDPVTFLNDWVWLYEPRNPGRGLPAVLPLTLRPRQVDFIRYLQNLRRNRRNGLVEKSRDEGMTWVVIGYYVWAWLHEAGFSGGLGSRKLDLVDKSGDLDTLFEKARFIVRKLPAFLKPQGFSEKLHSKEALLINPTNNANIKGEGGDNIGRGGRSSIYFVDEHAKVPRADTVHAALSQNTDVIVYGSTPHGRANLFARIAHNLIPGDPWDKFTFHWRNNPDKNYVLAVPALTGKGQEQVSPWYLFEKSKSVDQALFEQEVDISYDAETKNQIILGAWVQAALKLRLEATAPATAGLDVGDTGPDATVYSSRSGSVVTRIQDLISAEAPQEAHELATRDRVTLFQYDRNGVGAAIAATIDRRTDRAYEVRGVFNGGVPSKTVYEDSQTPADLRFANFATECWWRLRLRFQKTWERVEQGIEHPDDECISLALLPAGDALNALVAQLSQATYSRVGTSDKLIVNKKGEGGKSPNHAEALIYAFAPPPPGPPAPKPRAAAAQLGPGSLD